MKVTLCDCCKRVCDVYTEMIFHTFKLGMFRDEVEVEREVTICDDCLHDLGYLAEGGDLKKLIDKAEKRRRRR